MHLTVPSTATVVHSWSQRYGDVGNDTPLTVAVDASSNVIVAGDFTGTVNFGGANLTSAGSKDIFVAKFNAAASTSGASDLAASSPTRRCRVAVEPPGT